MLRINDFERIKQSYVLKQETLYDKESNIYEITK